MRNEKKINRKKMIYFTNIAESILIIVLEDCVFLSNGCDLFINFIFAASDLGSWLYFCTNPYDVRDAFYMCSSCNSVT